LTIHNNTQILKNNVLPSYQQQQLYDSSYFFQFLYHQKTKQYEWSSSIQDGMRWLDKIVLQDVKGIKGYDYWCLETSMRDDENNKRDQYNDYRDRGDNPKSKH